MDSLFRPVLDISEGAFTVNQIQGVFGEFVPVLDDEQGVVAPPASGFTYIPQRMRMGMGY